MYPLSRCSCKEARSRRKVRVRAHRSANSFNGFRRAHITVTSSKGEGLKLANWHRHECTPWRGVVMNLKQLVTMFGVMRRSTSSGDAGHWRKCRERSPSVSHQIVDLSRMCKLSTCIIIGDETLKLEVSSI